MNNVAYFIAVDGQWGSWGSYSTCSKTCGIGYKSRNRNCNNPSPVNNGKYCVGHPIENIECNIGSCGIFHSNEKNF